MDTVRNLKKEFIGVASNGHNISFSKKSLTIDDKEYLYIGISEIKHSSAEQLYVFKYEDSWRKLPYDEASHKTVAAILKKVENLNAGRAAKAEEESPAQMPAEGTPSLVEALEENAGLADETPKAESAPCDISPEQALEKDSLADQCQEEVVSEEKTEESEKQAEEKAQEATEENTEEQAEDTTEENAEEQSEEQLEAAHRKKRLKKAFIALAIVVVLFILAGIGYYFIFGTSKDASQSPNTDSTHEYNDIDELINEMNK